MKITEQIRRECIKAFAYGRSRADVCDVMNVFEEDVQRITEKEITQQRNYLTKMGYI